MNPLKAITNKRIDNAETSFLKIRKSDIDKREKYSFKPFYVHDNPSFT